MLLMAALVELSKISSADHRSIAYINVLNVHIVQILTDSDSRHLQDGDNR